MIDTKHIRSDYKTASIKLARARRLYIFLTRKGFHYAGNDYFDYVADNLKESGMYAKTTSPRAMRQAIARHIFKIEYPRFNTSSKVYREWLFMQGIDYHSGYFKPIIEQKRVANAMAMNG